MTLLAAAFILMIAAASKAYAAHIPPHNICLVQVCDSEGNCVLTEVFC
jgi:hypothetical protein